MCSLVNNLVFCLLRVTEGNFAILIEKVIFSTNLLIKLLRNKDIRLLTSALETNYNYF